MRSLVATRWWRPCSVTSACSSDDDRADPYTAQTAAIGESLAMLGWNMSVSNLRFDGDYVLVDVDASPSGSGAHAEPEGPAVRALRMRWRIRIEANAIGGCRDVTRPGGPTADRADARPAHRHGVPRAAAGPVPGARGVRVLAAGPDGGHHHGLRRGVSGRPAADQRQRHRSVAADRPASTRSAPTAPSSTRPRWATPTRSPVSGYMLLGLEIGGLAAQYRDDVGAARRTDDGAVPPDAAGPGLCHACDVYGASLLVLPDTSLRRRRRCGRRCARRAISTPRCSTRRCHWSARMRGCGP